jgi:predicted enzyme related to lactoylglutathione lyase
MSERQLLPGKFVWFEHVSADPKKAQAFYGEVLGWRVVPFPMGSFSYEMIYVGETMIGGYTAPFGGRQDPRWLSCVSVEDVDAAVRAATANGGKVVEAAHDIPQVGRRAVITDPQGVELCLFRSTQGDPPDREVPNGEWMWNELHTSDPAAALSFYEKVVGFSQKAMPMGPGETYHILSKNDVDRGGATHHLPPGVPPHWLPYVRVADPDATVARARKQGGTVAYGPEDIPGVGRFAVILDPTGAALAVMNPLPRAK